MRTASNLSAVFKEAWTKGGGTIPKFIIYNQQQPTLDSEAQQLVDGNPDGWLFIDFCQTFEKLALPLTRTGKWDAAKSFGSDTLNDCAGRGSKNYPGMRATQANASSGSSFPAFKALFAEEREAGRELPVLHRRVLRQHLRRVPRRARGEVRRSGEDRGSTCAR